MNAARRALALLAGAMLAAMSGCALVPPARTPAPATLGSDALGLHGAELAPAPQRWWEALGDRQLDALIDTALQGSPQLAQARARLQAAQAQADVARAAQLPQASFSGAEDRTGVPTDFGPYLLGGQGIWYGNLGAVLSWDPDLWGEHAQQRLAARDAVQAAALDVAEARLLLTGAILQAYLDLDSACHLADVAQGAESQRERILEITRRRVRAGLDTRVELREAEGALPQARVALLQAQAAEDLARHQLALLSGQGADAYARIHRPQLNLSAVLPLPSALPIDLLARRPDVFAAQLRIQAADAQRLAARAAFYPTLDLRALAGFAAISLPQLLSAGAFGFEVGPAIRLPLFDAGRLQAQYRGASAVLTQAVAGYDATVLTAVQQAADQLTLIGSLGQQLQQQQQWLAASEEAYRLDEERYRAGLASYLSVLNAETEVLSARRARVQLDNARASARITLMVAVGGDFAVAQPPGGHAAAPGQTALLHTTLNHRTEP